MKLFHPYTKNMILCVGMGKFFLFTDEDEEA